MIMANRGSAQGSALGSAVYLFMTLWYEGAFLSVNSASKAAVSYDERKAEQ
jgi:hypothetical protein